MRSDGVDEKDAMKSDGISEKDTMQTDGVDDFGQKMHYTHNYTDQSLGTMFWSPVNELMWQFGKYLVVNFGLSGSPENDGSARTSCWPDGDVLLSLKDRLLTTRHMGTT